MSTVDWKYVLTIVPSALAVFGCGGGGDSDEVAPTTVAQPAGGTYRAAPSQVTLVADESATIYYTTDGSTPSTSSTSADRAIVLDDLNASGDALTIRFFSVDAAGNQEAMREEVYTIAAQGPQSARNLNITVNEPAATANLSWDGAAGAAGYIVARIKDSQAAALADGVSYSVSDALADGGEIVYVGSGTAYQATALPAGGAAFAVWAQHANNVYSSAITGFAVMSLGDLTGEITLNMSTGTVAVTRQPAALQIAVDHQWNGTTDMAFYVRVINPTARTLFAPKLIATSISEGNISNNHGTLASNPYWRLSETPSVGPESAAPSRNAYVYVFGTSNNATVTMNVEVQMDRGVLGDTWDDERDREFIDLATGFSYDANPVVGTGFGGNRRFANGTFSGDGRYVTLVSSTSPSIWTVDVDSWNIIGGSEYNTNYSKSGFSWAQFTDDAIYAVLQDGGHSYKWPSVTEGMMNFYLVKIDRATLMEIERVQIAPTFGDDETRAKRFAISPDGSKAAIPLLNWKVDYNDDATNDGDPRSEIHIVDLNTMQVTQTVNVTGHVTSQVVAFSGDGTKVYSGSSYEVNDFNPLLAEEVLGVVDLSNGSVSTLPTTDRVKSLLTGSDGKIWMGQDSGVFIYDPLMNSETQWSTNTNDVTAMQFIKNDGSDYLMTQDYEDYGVYDLSDESEVFTVSGSNNHYSNWFAVTPY